MAQQSTKVKYTDSVLVGSRLGPGYELTDRRLKYDVYGLYTSMIILPLKYDIMGSVLR